MFSLLNQEILHSPSQKKVRQNQRILSEGAILREEGSNGDREMASAFIIRFDVWDVTMTDLLVERQSGRLQGDSVCRRVQLR